MKFYVSSGMKNAALVNEYAEKGWTQTHDWN